MNRAELPTDDPLRAWLARDTDELIHRVGASVLWGRASTHGRTDSRLPDSGLITIARGAHLPRELLSEATTPWSRRNIVDIARITVVAARLPDEVIFCRDSALVLLGIPHLAAAPDIHALTVGRQDRLRASLPAVTWEGAVLSPSARVRLHHSPGEGEFPFSLAGLPVAGIEDVLVGVARFVGAREAVASLSMALHELAGFDRWQSTRSRHTEELFKQRLLARLDTSPNPLLRERAREVIAASDAACDSIAEACLVWFLHAHGAHHWMTQCEVPVDGRPYFPDFMFPDLHLIIEVDGFAKLGTRPDDVRRNANRQFTRGSELEAAGWRVIHIPAALVLGPPQELFAHLSRVAPEIFAGSTVPSLIRY